MRLDPSLGEIWQLQANNCQFIILLFHNLNNMAPSMWKFLFFFGGGNNICSRASYHLIIFQNMHTPIALHIKKSKTQDKVNPKFPIKTIFVGSEGAFTCQVF